MFSEADIAAIFLTLKLATVVTIILFLVSTPIAWWLAFSQSRWRTIVNAMIALPLILPPTVLGFYLLLAMGNEGWLGQLYSEVFGSSLIFSFSGLVVASVFYSLPFVVQPLQNAFKAIEREQLDLAATMGAGPADRFFSVALPQAKNGFLAAGILGFAHTVGEFGVVLMIGGNIPGATKVISIQIYEHVELLNYSQAHILSACLLAFSFITLFILYWVSDSASFIRSSSRVRLHDE
ncbi:MAG: molybdate ABC transporter permease subunit [Gammaproteobacteria bacterium]|nr:molybdate ABC transporter permease subunit [Gammaproteobacteria bacterium]